jgi:hypothetical protein
MEQFERISKWLAIELETAIQTTIKALIQNGHVMPMGIIVKGAERVVVPLPWEKSTASKERFAAEFTTIAKKVEAELVIVISEAWVKRFNDSKDVNLEKPAGEYPDRIEAITVLGQTAEESVGIYVPFEREGKRVVKVGKPEVNFAAFERLFSGIFTTKHGGSGQ